MILQLFLFMFFHYTLSIKTYDEKIKEWILESNPYDRFSFPSNTLINYTIAIEIESIIEVNTITSMAKIRVILREYWHDQRLAWNKTEFNGIDTIQLPTNREMDWSPWVPDLIIIQAAELPMSELGETYCRVKSSGDVYWSRLGVLTVNLEMNIGKYPYDIQKIKMTFRSLNYQTDKLLLKGNVSPPPIRISPNHFSPNIGWDIIKLSYMDYFRSYENWGNFSEVNYEVQVLRAGKTIRNTLIIPAVGLGLLSLLYILMPRGKGERIEFLNTLLITEVMLLVLLTQFLPVSKNDPILENILLFLSFMMLFITSIVTFLDFYTKGVQKKKKISAKDKKVNLFQSIMDTNNEKKVSYFKTEEFMNKIDIALFAISLIFFFWFSSYYLYMFF